MASSSKQLGKLALDSHHFWSIDVRKKRFGLRDGLFLIGGSLIALVAVGIPTYLHRTQVPLAAKDPKITSPWVPSTVKYWESTIDEMAAKYNVDPNLIAIIMTMESGGYAKADSGEANGLMQITPLTAQDIASKYLKQPVTSYKLTDPKTSIEFGAAYLAYLRDTFGDWQQGPSWTNTVELVAAGYNGGPGAAERLGSGEGLTDTQTVIYSRDAFNMWRERFSGDSPTFDRWKERGGGTLINAAAKAHQ